MVLLTGSTGFTGRNLKEALSSDFFLLGPGHTELDLTDQRAVNSYLKSHDIDAVIHAAIKPMHRNAKDTDDLLKTNLLIYYNIANAVEKNGIKMLFIGSGCCYDSAHYIPSIREEYFGEHIPTSTEGLVKYTISSSVLSSRFIYDLRVFGLFGKYEDYAIRFISNAICKALFNMPITLRQNRRFSYLCINDLSKIVSLMIKKELNYRAYNIVPDNTVTLLELAEIIHEEMGSPLPIQIEQEGIGMDYTGDNTRFRSEFPDFKFTDIRVAIKGLIDWYKNNQESINVSDLLVDR
jgi:GDP-L-fucose synthase